MTCAAVTPAARRAGRIRDSQYSGSQRAADGGERTRARPGRRDWAAAQCPRARGWLRRPPHGRSLGLRRRDVDLLHGEIHVLVQAQEITGEGRVVVGPKTEAGRRVVTVPLVVVEALDEHLATFVAPEPDACVFTGAEGGPLRRARLSEAWRAALTAAGAPDGLRLHDLRHHALTLSARMPGVTTKELMARAGHTSPRAALIYQHATAERDRAIADHLDAVIASARRTPKAVVVGLPESSWGVGGGLDGPRSLHNQRRNRR